MKEIKHIFFDLDNTLWDFEKNSREALSELFNRDGIEKQINAPFDDFIKVYEVINHELWRAYGLQQTTKEELRVQRFSKSFEYYNFDKPELANQWADDYLTISPYKTHLIDGALDVLNYLKEYYTLHLITNGFKEVQHIKLDNSNIKSFFNHIIISEEHGYNKPHLQLFEIAEKLSGAQKTECIMIGDNYEADVEGALNAGWKAIYFSNTEKSNVLSIRSLFELKSMF